MAITVTVRMADDIANPIVEKTACHIEIAGLDKYTADPIEGDASHTTQNVYRIQCEKAGEDTAQSVAFTPDEDGEYEWDGYIFPASGSWDVKVYSLDENGDLDSAVKTQAVTVAAS